MKTKAPLAVIEILFMLLVFAVAAAICLKTFAVADRISEESRRLDFAVTEVQNAAEVMKGCSGDFAAAARILGGVWDGETLRLVREEYTVSVVPNIGDNRTQRAHITAISTAGVTLFSVEVAWQEWEVVHE